MKRILSLLLCLIMLLPLCSCASSLAVEEEPETEAVSAEEKKTEKKGEIVYPDAFSVGFARVDITGTAPIPVFEAESSVIADPLMLTCTAIWDGEVAALLMSADIRSFSTATANTLRERVEKDFGIPAENVFLNATHTHSAPAAGGSSDASTRWLSNFYKQFSVVIDEALRDLAPVTAAFTGKGETESLTFVRRYLLPDGTYRTNPGSRPVVSHESEADPELNTLRFEREGKKDVLMVNYQTHHVGVGGDKVSADYVGHFRIAAEEEFDAHFAYHVGAGGNVNFLSSIPGERIYPDYISAAKGMMLATRQALAAEEPIQTGKIQAVTRPVTLTVRKDDPQRIADATIVMAGGEEKRDMLAAQYGFSSWRAANATVSRSKRNETEEVSMYAISFGEIAFAGAPYEMFDTNGKQVRDASPFKTTFVCSLTNGAHGYIASKEAFPHGAYEVDTCAYVEGTGELLVQKVLEYLNECKNAA